MTKISSIQARGEQKPVLQTPVLFRPPFLYTELLNTLIVEIAKYVVCRFWLQSPLNLLYSDPPPPL